MSNKYPNCRYFNLAQTNVTKSLFTYIASGSGKFQNLIFGIISGSGAGTSQFNIYDGCISQSISTSIDTGVTKSHVLTAVNTISPQAVLIGSINLDSVTAISAIHYGLQFNTGLTVQIAPTGSVNASIVYEN
jgi:hypothetical protein